MPSKVVIRTPKTAFMRIRVRIRIRERSNICECVAVRTLKRSARMFGCLVESTAVV